MDVEIERLPRIKLAHLPTPLEFAKRLTEYLGGPQIWIKRDDCTGLAFGGNKARKLEFFIGDAIRRNTDTIVTVGPVQSNHVRMTVAAACKLGFGCHAILVGEEKGEPKGNFLLDQLFDLNFTIISKPLDELPPGLVNEKIEEIINRLDLEGRKPYLVPPGGAGPLGEISYAVAMKEIVTQCQELGIQSNYIITPVGSQGTLSGLLLGKKMQNLKTKIIGVSVNLEGTCELTGLPKIEEMVKDAGNFIDLQVEVFPDDYTILYDYVGQGYGIPTKEGLDAIKLIARKEGILLDPTYTGKSMAALIDLVSKGRFDRKDVVVYLHTGGTPNLFAGHKYLD